MKSDNIAHALRCGAQCRTGLPCKLWPVVGRQRCRMHGGRSTGPKTKEGLQRIIDASTIHSRRSKAERENRRETRALIQEAKELIRQYHKRLY